MSFIQAGKRKGHKLLLPDKNKDNIRVLTNRLKQGLFSMISGAIIDAKVLDLFCGIGSFGIEAISRGAEKCDFVDHSISSEYLTIKNLEKTQFIHRANFYKMDVLSFVKSQAVHSIKYRVIFIDPPYQDSYITYLDNLLDKIVEIVEDKGIVIVKHPKEYIPRKLIESKYGTLEIDKQKKYSISYITMYFFEKCTKA